MILLPGQQLLDLCQGARKEVLLVAPFIKSEALKRVIEVIPEGTSVKCVARWLPEDISAGSCDIEVYDLIQALPRGEFFCYSRLHAKYYRVDDQALMGSANLTARGLGWSANANLELLQPTDPGSSQIKNFEKHLLGFATRVDDDTRAAVAEAVEHTTPDSFPASYTEQTTWLPTCKRPDQLWSVYAETTESPITSTLNAAKADLQEIGLSPGLTEPLFYRYVADFLSASPVFIRLHEVIEANGIVEDDDADDIFRAYGGSATTVSQESWEIFKNWISFFLKDKYERLPVKEGFILRDK